VFYLGQYFSRLDLGVLCHNDWNINKEHPNLSYQATMQRLRDSEYQPWVSSFYRFSVTPYLLKASWLSFSPYHFAPAFFAIDIETWRCRIGFLVD